ncbi:MAG: GtrA family protein [bacterium]|nr:GtrA family protein [bacterium]
MTSKDLVASLVIGFLVALFFIPISTNLDVQIPFLWSIVVVFPLLAAAGTFVASLIGKFIPVVFQLAKFLLVGGLNTFVDLGVLNFLISLTGFATGAGYSALKGVSFLCAVMNSYFWNRQWTFRAQKKEIGTEFAQFLLVSVIGFLLNVGSASLIVNVLAFRFAVSGITENLWANIGAMGAAFVSLAWNFVGYKVFVFKK